MKLYLIVSSGFVESVVLFMIMEIPENNSLDLVQHSTVSGNTYQSIPCGL
jgi:hypothetical protein